MAVKAVALVALAAVGALFAIGLIANPIGAIALGAIGGVFLTALIINIAMKCLTSNSISEDKNAYSDIKSEIMTIYPRENQEGAEVSEITDLQRPENGAELEVSSMYFKDHIQRSLGGNWTLTLGSDEFSVKRDNSLLVIRKCREWVEREFSGASEVEKKQMVIAILDSFSQQTALRFVQEPLMTKQMEIISEGRLLEKNQTIADVKFYKTDDGKLAFNHYCKSTADYSGGGKAIEITSRYTCELSHFTKDGWKEKLKGEPEVVIN